MVTKDVDRAIARFLAASDRIRRGLVVQRERLLSAERSAPKLFNGTAEQTTDLTVQFENDLDYYIYEMGRLRALVKSMQRPFGFPEEVDEALKTFDACVPNLVRIRDARTHPADTNQLDRIGTFSAAVELHPDGSVTYLVDPRHRHHEAALALLDVVQNYLHRNLRERIALDPAKSVEEQIHERNSRGTS
jgi:hypothetical protein